MIVFFALGIMLVSLTIWLSLMALYVSKQSLMGVWIASLPAGERVILQFQGEAKGGMYRQLRIKDDTRYRESGCWSVALTRLNMLVMATDVKDHLRFGQDVLYTVGWFGKDSIIIDGPDRHKIQFHRSQSDIHEELETAFAI